MIGTLKCLINFHVFLNFSQIVQWFNLLKNYLKLTQHREFLFEIGCTTAFVGLYHLVSEKSSDAAQKPHYYQPYECGFNLLGGVLFAGYTFLIWIFLPGYKNNFTSRVIFSSIQERILFILVTKPWERNMGHTNLNKA